MVDIRKGATLCKNTRVLKLISLVISNACYCLTKSSSMSSEHFFLLSIFMGTSPVLCFFIVYIQFQSNVCFCLYENNPLSNDTGLTFLQSFS